MTDRATIADLLAITESLRVEGGLAGRRLAERIIEACLFLIPASPTPSLPTP